MQDNYLMVQR